MPERESRMLNEPSDIFFCKSIRSLFTRQQRQLFLQLDNLPPQFIYQQLWINFFIQLHIILDHCNPLCKSTCGNCLLPFKIATPELRFSVESEGKRHKGGWL